MPNTQPAGRQPGDRGGQSTKKQRSVTKTPGRRHSKEELSRHQRAMRANRMLMIGMGIVALVVVSILGFGWWREYVARASEPVAYVAGRPIGIESYARRLDFHRKMTEQQMQFMQMQLQVAGSEESVASMYRQQIQQLQFALLLLPDQTLDMMVEEELLRQEAARRGIQVAPDEVEEQIRKLFGGQPEAVPAPSPEAAGATGDQPTAEPLPTVDAQAEFTGFLTRYGISGSMYRSMLEAQILEERLQAAIGSQVPTSGEQVRARHILVESEEQAKELLEKLKSGATFEALAREESQDAGSKEKGGDLGWFPRGMMVAEFETAAFELPLGQLSAPVQTFHGWHIIEVLEKEENRALDEEALAGRKRMAFTDWMEEAKKGSDVKLELTEERKKWAFEQIRWSPAF